ncbi:MAG: AMP-binding protein [Actinophytocola sp.]|nr:AMP-binding protein [Actinophytocola sp.]
MSLGEQAAAARLALTNAPALLRSGLLAPARPSTLARMAGSWWNWRASPATLCAAAAARWPGEVAVIDELGQLTYGELDRRAAALADGLAAESGIGQGTAVAMMCRNHRGFLEAAVAAGRLGADLLLLNTELPARALAQLVAKHDISAVICDEEFGRAFEAAEFAGPLVLSWHEGGSEHTIDSLVRKSAPQAPRPHAPGKVVILTSGTTGVPKGVPRTPSAMDTMGIGVTVIARMSLRTKEAMVIAPPLFHGFGLAFLAMAMLMGHTVVLRRKFDPEALLADIERHRVTTMLAVPAMLQRILQLPQNERERYDTSSLRAAFSGAAPLSPALASRFTAVFGQVLYNGYGSSEAGVATVADPADLAAAPGTVGRPVSGVDVRVLGSDGEELPPGAIGRVCVGSSLTFEGYSGGGPKPELTRGLMPTGDLGHRDADGRIFIDGREDDMIVSGGENIFPQEVEHVLAGHDAISEVAVVGVADEEFGQRLKAFVVTRPGSEVSADELKDYLREHLARYMVPKEFVFLAELPRNATGKLLRSKLT